MKKLQQVYKRRENGETLYTLCSLWQPASPCPNSDYGPLLLSLSAGIRTISYYLRTTYALAFP